MCEDFCIDISQPISNEQLFERIITDVISVKIINKEFIFKRKSSKSYFGFKIPEKMCFEKFAFLCKSFCAERGFVLTSSKGKCSYTPNNGTYCCGAETEIEAIFLATKDIVKVVDNR